MPYRASGNPVSFRSVMSGVFRTAACCALLSGAAAAASASTYEQEWIALQSASLKAVSEGRLDYALESAQSAANLAETRFGREHMKTALSYKRLADIYAAAGKKDEAIQAIDRTVELWLKIFGDSDPIVMKILDEKYRLFLHSGEKAEALKTLDEMRSAAVKIFGIKHTKTASVYEKMADSYWQAGESEAALQYSGESLKIYKEVADKADPRYLNRLRRHAEYLSQNGDNSKALDVWSDYAEGLTEYHQGHKSLEVAQAWVMAAKAALANYDLLSGKGYIENAVAYCPEAASLTKNNLKVLQDLYRQFRELYNEAGDPAEAERMELLASELETKL